MHAANARDCLPMLATPAFGAPLLVEPPPQPEIISPIAVSEPASEAARRRDGHLWSLALVVDGDGTVCM
jgi:hypothetical protein